MKASTHILRIGICRGKEKIMIRNIKAEDAPALKQICKTALGHDTTSGYLKHRIQELSHDPCYYIAVYEDDITHQILGFIQAEKYNLLYGDNGWNIIALAVSPKAQRQGIGRQLLTSLENQAVKQGYMFIRLNCNTVRADAHAFYHHMEYTCDKTQKRFIKQIER